MNDDLYNKLRAMMERSQPPSDKKPDPKDILGAIMARKPQRHATTIINNAHFETLDQTDKWVEMFRKQLQLQHFSYSKDLPITGEALEFFEELWDQMDNMGYDVNGLYDFLIDKYQLIL